MLYYLEAGISPYEVPDKITLLIFICGCTNNCLDCHYPDLKKFDNGISLSDNFKNLVDVYLNYISCICFLGEGDLSSDNENEFNQLCSYAKSKNLYTCLYSGRDCQIEMWMNCFDYIKIGSYRKENGPLNSKNTNQRFYRKIDNIYRDITSMFWN
ncbi:hypothetical protein MKA27_17280 [[Clostridium] innocuum]|uniref:4Fe-4S cluster-binding domain-containing protein n=1 Tax=Clostridium innocuum TaxID=1522 RepID=UPI000D6CA3AB|nr:4Fe-4S cluster-binding domain-containing protein [[Clostridium] innocuum]MCR0317372.1 hypothetical protein [[Clostridium] innocuum]MCR0370981.1 hypothetical protein [[Clostridium] innocuum]MCR0375564.1 hypothetical protein [[Clostridium] innocuum]MCR0560958.1 hypothetical protein [[Clostridium] innocuum]MCR0603732.1 hypothetical protein [[Clostridium] innocuum]